jgi:hypothetical protein
MANDLTGNPWIIDTPSATTVHTNVAVVNSLTWSGYTSGAADQIIVRDQRGRTIFSAVGHVDLTPIQLTFSPRIFIRSLTVPTLTTGILSVGLS